MSYDNICKTMAERHPVEFVRWAARMTHEIDANRIGPNVHVLKSELGIEPIRADFAAFLETGKTIVHFEFQVVPESKPPMPLRMLDYATRFYRTYPGRNLVQLVVLLKNTPTARTMPDVFEFGHTRHGFFIVRLWEVEPETLLENPALLPLAVLAKSPEPKKLLRRVANRAGNIENRDLRVETLAGAHILAGLRFTQHNIGAIFQEAVMQESVTYQTILQRGVALGLEKGLEQGLEKGLEQGLEKGLEQGSKREAQKLVLGILEHRFSKLSTGLKKRIEQLPLTELEALGLALLDFTSKDDLKKWLAEHEE